MQETLLEDKTVDWAGYDQPHPLFRQSIITIRVKGEAQPEKALERASKKIRADTEEFVEKFSSAIKNENSNEQARRGHWAPLRLRRHIIRRLEALDIDQ